jgi:DNA (cytosine-5)-methyltransferase 1
VPAARTAVDLFAGAGGTSQGLKDAGFKALAAVENDPAAARTYRVNHPDTELYEDDIRRVDPDEMAERLCVRPDILTACPPCQGFSTLGSGDAADERNDLVLVVEAFVAALKPRCVLLENVPGLAADERLDVLEAALADDYAYRRYIVDAVDFGVPQHRRRVIVVAIERPFDDEGLGGDLVGLVPDGFDRSPTSAGAALRLAGPVDGADDADDAIHRARRSAPLTLERIRAMSVGGGRRDLPEHLRLACHDRLNGTHATSIYGRIDPERPSPTMTTRCTTPSCGRFVHPVEDRGLTLREAALLQTFPRQYAFEGNYGEIERQIGNAVPARVAEALGLVADNLLGVRDAAGASAG